MKRQLENLDTIRVVSVEKITPVTNVAVAWTVTFDTELGDLPMLEITSGRLTGTDAPCSSPVYRLKASRSLSTCEYNIGHRARFAQIGRRTKIGHQPR